MWPSLTSRRGSERRWLNWIISVERPLRWILKFKTQLEQPKGIGHWNVATDCLNKPFKICYMVLNYFPCIIIKTCTGTVGKRWAKLSAANTVYCSTAALLLETNCFILPGDICSFYFWEIQFADIHKEEINCIGTCSINTIVMYLLATLHCSIVMVSWVSAYSSKCIERMFSFLCRSMNGKHSSITSSCRGGRGRRRRGRGKQSTWPAGKGSGMTVRVTPLGITTTTKVTAANHAPGVEGAEGQTNPRGQAPCWPTIMWWS